MKIDRFELHINKEFIDDNGTCDHDHGQYCLAGEEIQGSIEVAVRERLRVARLSLRLIGILHTAWYDFNEEYESKELFLDEYKDLTSDLSIFCNEVMEILWGEHKINFALKLPVEAISTIKKEGFGYVKYTMIATLDIPEEGGDSEIVAEKEIPVHAFLSLDSPHFIDPVQSSEQLSVITRPWLCFKNFPRLIRATLSASSMGILPGDTCILTFMVENKVKKALPKKHNGSEHHCSLISLCQQIDFRSRSKNDSQNWNQRSITTAVQSYGICKANTRAGPETRTIHFKIPQGLPPTSARMNGLISCSYFFRIEVQEQFDVILPIVVGSYKTVKEDINNSQLPCNI